MKKIIYLFLILLPVFLITGSCHGQKVQPDKKTMQWFADAKLGIFIHWGIYAVNGIGESWSFYNNEISHEDYLKQLNGFTASNYHPEEWAGLFKESGARYAVLTSKHHDGVALWDTRYGDLNVVERTPAKRDLIGPYVDALRKNDLKVGLYFSLIDWSYPDYPVKTKTEKRYENDPQRWNKFVKYYYSQVEVLIKKYQPDLLWFDGAWEHSAEEWHAKELRKD